MVRHRECVEGLRLATRSLILPHQGALDFKQGLFQACLTPPTPTQALAALNLPRVMQEL